MTESLQWAVGVARQSIQLITTRCRRQAPLKLISIVPGFVLGELLEKLLPRHPTRSARERPNRFNGGRGAKRVLLVSPSATQRTYCTQERHKVLPYSYCSEFLTCKAGFSAL